MKKETKVKKGILESIAKTHILLAKNSETIADLKKLREFLYDAGNIARKILNRKEGK